MLSQCSAEDQYQNLNIHKKSIDKYPLNVLERAFQAPHTPPRAAPFNLGLKRCHSRHLFSLRLHYSAADCCIVCTHVGIPADPGKKARSSATTAQPPRIQAVNGTAGPRSDHRPGWVAPSALSFSRIFQSEDPLQVDLAVNSVYLRSCTSFPPQTGDNKIFILILEKNHFPKRKMEKKLICGL